MENQGFSQQGTSLALSFRVHENSKAALLLSLIKQTTHVHDEYQRVTNLSRDTTKCPDLDHNTYILL